MRHVRILAAGTLLGLAALGAGSAQADVQAGIAAWRAGDYERAIAEWRPLADAGDADAQFNLAQAYRLGRGVPQDLGQAERWYEAAARQRHEQAGTNLGLLLFQNGRAREAMPWIQAAALRGDPRAQYVFGTALFNGDVVRRDLPRAYALMSMAARQGFPQAADQLRQMEAHLSADERRAGEAMARQMASGAAPSPAPTPAPSEVAQRRTIERPLPRVEPEPHTPRRPGSDAGVSYRPSAPVRPDRQAAAEPARPSTPRPRAQEAAPRPTPARPAQAQAAPSPSGGAWQVQLGAFSTAAGARRQWEQVRRRVPALAGLSARFVQAGAVTRLRAGNVASRAAAERLCSAARGSGIDCIPVVP